jgi:imidazolonepropionase-like amidohydrolase
MPSDVTYMVVAELLKIVEGGAEPWEGRDMGTIEAMKIVRYVVCGLLFCALVSPPLSAQASEKKRIVIAASTVLDGRGVVLHDTRIVIEGSKIVAIDPKAGPVDYDLRGLTVLPGWIDSHVHLRSFGRDGRNGSGGWTGEEAAYQPASNAWVTLMAGFTTVQSVGSATDIPLRDAIAQGLLPGPRILTLPTSWERRIAGHPRRSAPL